MNRYKAMFDRVPDNINVERNALENTHRLRAAPSLHARRTLGVKRAKGELPRYAAIAAACVMLITIGSFVVRFLYGGGAPGNIVTPGNSGESLGAPLVEPTEAPSGVLHTELAPYGNAYSLIAYRAFSTSSSNPDNTPLVFENAEDLQAYIDENVYDYGIYEGSENSEMEWQSLLMMDFEEYVIVAVFGNDDRIPKYYAPVLERRDNRLYVYARTDERVPSVYDFWPDRGYFLVISRTEWESLVPDENGNTIIYSNEGGYDFASGDYADITPAALSGKSDVRVYKNSSDYETYLVRPGYAVMSIGTGLGGWGVSNVQVSDDLTYMIYTFSFGSGMHRSVAAVLYLDGSGRAWASGAYFHSDMIVEPEYDRWAMYQADMLYTSMSLDGVTPVKGKLLAYLMLTDDGVQVEVMDEDGYQLLGIYTQPDGITIEPSGSQPTPAETETTPYIPDGVDPPPPTQTQYYVFDFTDAQTLTGGFSTSRLEYVKLINNQLYASVSYRAQRDIDLDAVIEVWLSDGTYLTEHFMLRDEQQEGSNAFISLTDDRLLGIIGQGLNADVVVTIDQAEHKFTILSGNVRDSEEAWGMRCPVGTPVEIDLDGDGVPETLEITVLCIDSDPAQPAI